LLLSRKMCAVPGFPGNQVLVLIGSEVGRGKSSFPYRGRLLISNIQNIQKLLDNIDLICYINQV
ncbi:hypothetical protein CO110_09870, partial [Candidatus Desantisbacteria bacterium CG_4_9_14_3_um_filter_40_11]